MLLYDGLHAYRGLPGACGSAAELEERAAEALRLLNQFKNSAPALPHLKFIKQLLLEIETRNATCIQDKTDMARMNSVIEI